MMSMSPSDQAELLSLILEGELQLLPKKSQEAYLYLFARIAVELGTLCMVNDQLPEGGMRLVVREPSSGQLLVVQRPANWTHEDEERCVHAMRLKLASRS